MANDKDIEDLAYLLYTISIGSSPDNWAEVKNFGTYQSYFRGAAIILGSVWYADQIKDSRHEALVDVSDSLATMMIETEHENTQQSHSDGVRDSLAQVGGMIKDNKTEEIQE